MENTGYYEQACLVGDGEEWNGGVRGGNEAVKHCGMSVAASQQHSRIPIGSS